jgi:PucR family transcriptional regulator, purine catabolism regulatory protein
VLLLLDRPEMQIERRADQLYGELTQQVARGAGIEAVLCTVHEVTGRAVAYYDAGRELRMQYGSDPAPAIFAGLRPQAGRQVSGRDTLIIRAIGNGMHALGFIALGGTTIDLWDELAADRAAAALALELSKLRAVQAVEARAGGDLLRGLLDGAPLDMSILHQQAADMGYDLSRSHVAILMAPSDVATTTDLLRQRLQHELQSQQTTAPFVQYENTVLCLYPDDEQLAGTNKLLGPLSNDLRIGAGISAPASTAAGWQQAYTEAQQALALGRQLFGPDSVTAFSDLHVYRLLAELRASPSLASFHHSILGPLVEYDRRHNSALLDTLEVYFAARCNLREAAERLEIHRNTLLYRLRRISQIGHVDLERTENVLALQIALKAHRILILPGANGYAANGPVTSNGNGSQP